MHPDSFGARTSRTVGGRAFGVFRLDALEKRRVGKVSRLPFSIKILLENLLRHEDGVTVTADDIRALANWSPSVPSDREIAFRPPRVLLQDFTGVPPLVGRAAPRAPPPPSSRGKTVPARRRARTRSSGPTPTRR